jgi:hypothetical protein
MKTLKCLCLTLALQIGLVAKSQTTPQIFQPKGSEQYGFLLGRKCIVPAQYDSVRHFSEGLAAAKNDDGWGYVDLQGKMAIPHRFSQAYAFEDSMAIVAVAGRFGVIAPTGKWVLQPEYEQLFHYDSVHFQVQQAGKLGIVHRNGDWVVPAAYGFIFPPHENRIQVLDSIGLTGYLDTRFAPVIPFKFQGGGDFSEGLAAVHAGEEGWGYIDTSGAWHIAPRFIVAHAFYGGYAAVAEGFFEPRYGIIDRNGGFVLPPKFDVIEGPGGTPYLAKQGKQFSFFSPPDTLPILTGLDGAEVFLGDYAFVCTGCSLVHQADEIAWLGGRWALLHTNGDLFELPARHQSRTRLNALGLSNWDKKVVSQWQGAWLHRAKPVGHAAFFRRR